MSTHKFKYSFAIMILQPTTLNLDLQTTTDTEGVLHSPESDQSTQKKIIENKIKKESTARYIEVTPRRRL